MAKLLDQAKNAGMNSGATVLGKMKRLAELKRHPELESIFSIQPETLAAITESMKLYGYDKAQPIVEGKIDGEWYITDGYTRYAAALQTGIEEVPVDEKEFDNLEAAIHYCYKRQAERRNLSQTEIYNAAVKLNIPVQQIADELGVAVSTITRAKKIEREADPADIEAIKNNEKTINSVYSKIKSSKSKDDGETKNNDEDDEYAGTDGDGDTGNYGENTPDDDQVEAPGEETVDENQMEAADPLDADILDNVIVETETEYDVSFNTSDAQSLPENVKFLKGAVILLAESGEIKSVNLLVNHFLRKQERNGFLKLLPDNISGKLSNPDGGEAEV